jgi:hypothetical protein
MTAMTAIPRDDGDSGDQLADFALLALPVLLCLSHLQDEI